MNQPINADHVLRQFLSAVKDGPLFTLRMPDGKEIRLHWDGPRGDAVGIIFVNDAGWLLGPILNGEVACQISVDTNE